MELQCYITAQLKKNYWWLSKQANICTLEFIVSPCIGDVINPEAIVTAILRLQMPTP